MAIDTDRAVRNITTAGLVGAGLGMMFSGAGVGAAVVMGSTAINSAAVGGFAVVVGAALGAVIGITSAQIGLNQEAVLEQVRQETPQPGRDL